jgi:hypothetical protein
MQHLVHAVDFPRLSALSLARMAGGTIRLVGYFDSFDLLPTTLADEADDDAWRLYRAARDRHGCDCHGCHASALLGDDGYYYCDNDIPF